MAEEYKQGDEIPGTGYHYVSEIGAGGQGVVFEVRDPYLDTIMVMKLVTMELAYIERNKEHVREEARALAKLSSPHIVSVFRGGITAEQAARPYFVMPKLEGETLQARITRRGALGFAEALDIACQVLDGLDAAHHHPTHRMVHRDIKPANIFMHHTSQTDERAVILDFGIARLIDRARSERTADNFAGTFEYAAPEQYSASDLLPQTDLYAVAGVLFQMLTGRLPFVADSRMAIARQHLQDPPPPLSDFLAVPAALNELVLRALAKEPSERPVSAREFASALRAIAAGAQGSQPGVQGSVAYAKTEGADSPDIDRNALTRTGSRESILEGVFASAGDTQLVTQEVDPVAAGLRAAEMIAPAGVSVTRGLHSSAATPPGQALSTGQEQGLPAVMLASYSSDGGSRPGTDVGNPGYPNSQVSNPAGASYETDLSGTNPGKSASGRWFIPVAYGVFVLGALSLVLSFVLR
jgi:serine/threonine protein kinase